MRRTERSTLILPAALLGRVGFGEQVEVVRSGHGLVSREVVRAFELLCGCVVSEPGSVGGSCALCAMELAGQGVEWAWASRPCTKHARWCSYPLCATRSVCVAHSAQAPDGRVYCAPHYVALVGELERADREARFGPAAGVVAWWKSLFL